MSFYQKNKFYIYHNLKTSDFKNNDILFRRKINNYFIEIIYWYNGFEIFIRPRFKKYGYFIKRYLDINSCLNLATSITSFDIEYYFFNL